VRTECFKPGEFKVRDTQGKVVGAKQLPNRLLGETAALIHWGQTVLDPLHLRLIKDGTLVIWLPLRTTPAFPAVDETFGVPPVAVEPMLAPPAPAAQPPMPSQLVAPPVEPRPSLPITEPPAAAPPVVSLPPLPLTEPPTAVPSNAPVPLAAPSATLIPGHPAPVPLVEQAGQATGKAPSVPNNDFIVSATRRLQIPLDVKHQDIATAKAIRLRMSTDQGTNWTQIAIISPGPKVVTYNAPADGTYWFAIELAPADGKIVRLPPHMKVLVQTAAPTPPPWATLPAIKVQGHDDYLAVNARHFQIPIAVGPAQRQQIATIRLWVSTDKGKNWLPAGQVTPDVAAIPYSAASDGFHWFALQIVPKDGEADPIDIRKFVPQLKVVVHTSPPAQ
jgi:hypothetical protein